MRKDLPPHKNLILFDGVCNLCNGSVLFIIKRDAKDLFRFASLQSDLGQSFLKKNNSQPEPSLKSIILVTPEAKVYTKSSAALRIAKHLPGWKWMAVFLVLPRFLRDFVYDIIARNRYSWFGKREECMVPTPELKAKFLDA